jgi:hypothetical protein
MGHHWLGPESVGRMKHPFPYRTKTMSERFGRVLGTPWQDHVERELLHSFHSHKKLVKRLDVAFESLHATLGDAEMMAVSTAYQVSLLQAGYTHVDPMPTLQIALKEARWLAEKDSALSGLVEKAERLIAEKIASNEREKQDIEKLDQLLAALKSESGETAKEGTDRERADIFEHRMARISALLKVLKAKANGTATVEDLDRALTVLEEAEAVPGEQKEGS